MEKEKKEKVEKLRCVKCGSSLGYLRIKDHVFVCRSCGYEDEEIIS